MATQLEAPIILYPVQPELQDFTSNDRVFAAFFERDYIHDELGGQLVQTRPQIPINPETQTADFHVEASFTAEQLFYIIRCDRLLARVVGGSITDVSGESVQIPPLSAHAVNYIRGKKEIPTDNNYTTLYEESLYYGARKSIDAFMIAYPSMIPVLNAMFINAGSLGVFQAIIRSSTFPAETDEGVLTYEALDTHANDKLGMSHFVGVHPRPSPFEKTEYEVWCRGRSTAKELVRQAKLTALHIFNDVDVDLLEIDPSYRYPDYIPASHELRKVIELRYLALKEA